MAAIQPTGEALEWREEDPSSEVLSALHELPLEVTIAMDGEPVEEAMDASSILSLMSLGASHGDVVVLRAEGDGAEDALEALARIIETDHDAA